MTKMSAKNFLYDAASLRLIDPKRPDGIDARGPAEFCSWAIKTATPK
jgi:hypothetical protein